MLDDLVACVAAVISGVVWLVVLCLMFVCCIIGDYLMVILGGARHGR
jgi:hypothetical protein